MVQYLAKRIGRSLLTLFIIVTLVFCLLRLMLRQFVAHLLKQNRLSTTPFP